MGLEIRLGEVMVSRVELVAAAAIISVVVGLLLPSAVHQSLNRGILVLLCGTIGAGLVLGTQTDNSVRRTLTNALLSALLIPVTYIAFLIVRYYVSLISDITAPIIYLPGPSGAAFPVAIFGPSFAKTALILFIIASCTFVASYLLISLAALAAKPILVGTQSVYQFGDEGVAKSAAF